MRTKPKSVFKLLIGLSARELWRNKFGLVLLFVLPLVFLIVAALTSSTMKMPIKLIFMESTESILLSQKEISLVFVSAAVSGFLSAYYSVVLFHQDLGYFRYCVSLGMPPRIFTAARFSFFLAVVAVLAILITSVVAASVPMSRPFMCFLGFLLLGTIYGAYGGIAGVLSKNFMTAVLLIVLLANLDAGWLQNPVYYSYAQESRFIRWLPAFHPCQFIFSACFSRRLNGWSAFLGMAYACSFLLVLLFLVSLKLRRVFHAQKKR
jgi:hypothetical protein